MGRSAVCVCVCVCVHVCVCVCVCESFMTHRYMYIMTLYDIILHHMSSYDITPIHWGQTPYSTSYHG